MINRFNVILIQRLILIARNLSKTSIKFYFIEHLNPCRQIDQNSPKDKVPMSFVVLPALDTSQEVNIDAMNASLFYFLKAKVLTFFYWFTLFAVKACLSDRLVGDSPRQTDTHRFSFATVAWGGVNIKHGIWFNLFLV